MHGEYTSLYKKLLMKTKKSKMQNFNPVRKKKKQVNTGMQILWERRLHSLFSHCILGACESRGHTVGTRVHK